MRHLIAMLLSSYAHVVDALAGASRIDPETVINRGRTPPTPAAVRKDGHALYAHVPMPKAIIRPTKLDAQQQD